MKIPFLIFFQIVLILSVSAQDKKYNRVLKLMGSRFDISVIASTEEKGNEYIDIAISEIKRIESIISSYGYRAYDSVIKNKAQNLDNLIYRIQNNTEQLINKYRNVLDQNKNLLKSHNVEKILRKGFVLVKQDEDFILRAKNFNKEKETKLKFYDNEIKIN